MAIRSGESGEASSGNFGARAGARCSWVVGLCVGLLVVSTAARAQPAITMSRSRDLTWDVLGRSTRGDDLMPDYARLMAWDLRLDPNQRAAMLDLYDGFKAQWIDADERMFAYRDLAEQQLAGGPDPQLSKDLEDAWKRHGEFKKRIRARLDEDIKSILTDEQLARWAMVERTVARFRFLRNTEGEPLAKVDLARLAERATRKAGATPELLELADRYALDMGALVEEYNRWFAKWMADQPRRLASGDESAATGDWRMTRREQRKFMVRVADLNESYCLRLANLMSEEQRSAFLREYVLLGVYDGWQRRDPAMDMDEVVRRVRALEGVTPHVTEQIEALVAEYDRGYVQYHMAMLQRVRDNERSHLDTLDWRELDQSRTRLRGELWKEEGVERTQTLIEQLRLLLTPEQLETMPPPLGVRSLVPPVFED